MIVKNEAATLFRCLASASGFVEEMIVVDIGSGDNMKDIAVEQGASILIGLGAIASAPQRIEGNTVNYSSSARIWNSDDCPSDRFRRDPCGRRLEAVS